MYWVGYVIAFLILVSCRRVPPELKVMRGPYLNYLDDMGFTKPFTCSRGNPIFAAIQALWWPWPFIWLAIIIAVSPVIFIYIYLKDK